MHGDTQFSGQKNLLRLSAKMPCLYLYPMLVMTLSNSLSPEEEKIEGKEHPTKLLIGIG